MATIDIPAKTKLVAIVGETGSGKSALAMELAAKYNGEIIAADSRTVYKAMDIGTAKPSKEDQAKIPHHLIDVVAPDQPFNVAKFQKLAQAAIKDIQKRGKLPFLVGGTGLYVDAVLYNFKFTKAAEPEQRAALEKLSLEELQQKIIDADLPMPGNYMNPRHLVRTLETGGQSRAHQALPADTVVLGLKVPKEQLKPRLEARMEQMVAAGLVNEIKQLAAKYGWDTEALQAPGYKAFRSYLEGEGTLAQAKQRFVQNDLKLAKRQRTWFKRNPDIHWL